MHKHYTVIYRKSMRVKLKQQSYGGLGKHISASCTNCWGRGLSNNCLFDVLDLFMPSYASNIIFLRQTDEGVMK